MVREKRKNIDLDIEVVLVNNVQSSFSYSDNRDTFFSMSEYGDEAIVTFGSLRKISSGKHKKLLQDLYLLVDEVLDDEVTKEDVLKQLRLDAIYQEAMDTLGVPEGEELSGTHFFEFLENATDDEIKQALNNPRLKMCLTETAAELFKGNGSANGYQMPMGTFQMILAHNKIDDTLAFIEDLSVQM